MTSVQPNQQSPLTTKHNKKWVKKITIVLMVVVVFLTLIYFTRNKNWFSAAVAQKVGLTKLDCKLRGGEFGEFTASHICFGKSPVAGKVCTQDNDCLGGGCIPSETTLTGTELGDLKAGKGTLRFNADGRFKGTCSALDYRSGWQEAYPYYGDECAFPITTMNHGACLVN